MSAEAAYGKTGDATARDERLGRCAEKLRGAFEKAEARYGPLCPTSGDGPDVQRFVDATTDGITDAVDGRNVALGPDFCGPGTILDDATGACVAAPCGIGAVLDERSRRCVGEVVSSQGDPGPQYTVAGYGSRWIRRADMNQSRGGHAAAALDGRVYVVGGSGLGSEGSAEVYDPASDTWREVAVSRLPHGFGGAVTMRGSTLLRFGGIEPLTPGLLWAGVNTYSVYPEDFGRGGIMYARVTDLRPGDEGHAAVVVGDRVFVVGSGNTTEEYIIGRRLWRHVRQ